MKKQLKSKKTQKECKRNVRACVVFSKRGITLIALVITIIILLILAGITLSMTLGSNGIIRRAQEAAESYDISQYEEIIRLVESEAIVDKIKNNEIIFLDRVQELLEADPNFKEATMKRIQYEEKESLLIFVKNHAFIVNDDDVKYLGTTKEFNVPSAKGNLTVTKIPDTQWTTSVILTAEAKEPSYEIEYSIGNQENWKKYQETGLEITENTSVYFRLNIANVYGESVEIKVDNIDTIDPNAIIASMPTTAYVNQPKTAVVDLTDYESGINLEKSKWVYKNSNAPIGTDNISAYTQSFAANTDTITLTATSAGTWYLHVLVVDNADNMVEKISETGATITSLPPLVTGGKTYNYTGGIQTYTVPVTGIYKLEVYGAEGTTAYWSDGQAAGGKGGYSVGYKTLTEGTVLYIGVGGRRRPNFSI